MTVPAPEERPIALRAYALPVERQQGNDQTADASGKGGAPWGPSPLSVTLDIETTIGAEQRPRVGNYQVRRDGNLCEEGLFYDPEALSTRERRRLREYARRHDLVLRTIEEFDEQIIYRLAYRQNALIIGANLPFDLARLAYHHEAAKGRKMSGGFSFALSDHWPHLRIKHLSRTASLIDFAAPGGQRTARSWRRRGAWRNTRRGYFCDVFSLAAALTGSSHSLASLARLLGTVHQKAEGQHGEELSARYLRYLRNDVQVTWECYEVLAARYAGFGLTETPVSAILSEASIGKACLREMGVRPWRVLQPEVPPQLLGVIMSSYFGGRSEVHLRRLICRVLYCDFLSMYPTVSILMGLWRFVIATGIEWHEVTAETRALVDDLRIEDLARPETWRKLGVLVQVEAAADVFPVRTAYDDHNPAYSIGLNYLTSGEPVWFTLADVLVSKLLTGKTPRILRALAFAPREAQGDLRPVDILGNPAYRIDPRSEDFYCRLIELRSEVKSAMRSAHDEQTRARLAAEQQAMKITANAACYGIFVELNVQEYARKREVTYYGGDGQAHTTRLASIEEPGRFFHPLLATLTTGAARLMLAVAEARAEAEGIDWALCDTDSMALACPEWMAEEEFLARAERVRGWFEQLNPYASGQELFKVEDANKSLDAQEELAPLHCLAISDKRYVLFNVGPDGRPVLRKASAHGLGYLQPPYPAEKAPDAIPAPRVPLSELGVERWQHDLWYRIVEAALAGHSQQVNLDDLPGFSEVAVSRYAATRPRLLHWFDSHNKDRPYAEQVRPFGFLNAYQAKSAAQRDPWSLPQHDDGPDRKGKPRVALELPRAVSPYDPDPAAAVEHCFDRDSGEPVPPGLLRTYRQAVQRYHLHPESKFIGGNYTESGVLQRRHVRVPDADGIEGIGKEANRWEERSQTGEDPEGQIKYGTSGGSLDKLRDQVAAACREHGVRVVARTAGLAHSAVLRCIRGGSVTQVETVRRLQAALLELQSSRAAEDAVLEASRQVCLAIGLRQLAGRTGIDRANLRAVLGGRRRPSPAMLARLEAAVTER